MEPRDSHYKLHVAWKVIDKEIINIKNHQFLTQSTNSKFHDYNAQILLRSSMFAINTNSIEQIELTTRLPCQLDNQTSSRYECDHQAYLVTPKGWPDQMTNENKLQKARQNISTDIIQVNRKTKQRGKLIIMIWHLKRCIVENTCCSNPWDSSTNNYNWGSWSLLAINEWCNSAWPLYTKIRSGTIPTHDEKQTI